MVFETYSIIDSKTKALFTLYESSVVYSKKISRGLVYSGPNGIALLKSKTKMYLFSESIHIAGNFHTRLIKLIK